jgi:hypothetical protein
LNKNKTIERLLDFNKITEEEYLLLFCDKSTWDKNISFNKEKKFWETFSKIKHILSKKSNLKELKLYHQKSQYDFSYIAFPDMKNYPIYEEYLTAEDNNDGYIYSKSTNFSYCKFYGQANFNNVIFEDEVIFDNSVFFGDADFSEIIFEGDTFFRNVIFHKNVTFENSFCKDYTFDFSDVKLGKLKLDKSLFVHANYLNLLNINNKQVFKNNFATRETVRIIKSRFQEQKNTKDEYTFFVIEQNMFIKEIFDSESLSYYNKLIKLLPLIIDKCISNFGTDWIRVILWMIAFSILIFLIHNNINLTDFIKDFQNNKLYLVNEVIKLINPFTIFRKNDIYINNELMGIIVRTISIYLIWQFSKSFRLSTKNR